MIKINIPTLNVPQLLSGPNHKWFNDIEVRETTAKQLLHCTIKPGITLKGSQPPLVINGNVIAIHTNETNLAPYYVDITHENGEKHQEQRPGLYRLWSIMDAIEPNSNHPITMLIRAVPTSYEPFEKYTHNIRRSAPVEYKKYFDKYRKWGNPNLGSEEAQYSRELWVWGSEMLMHNMRGGPTCTLGARTVKYNQTGPALKAGLFGLPASSITDTPADLLSGRAQHISYAFPPNTPVQKKVNHWKINDKLWGFWNGTLTPENLQMLLDGPYDILIRFDRVKEGDKTFFYTTTLFRQVIDLGEESELAKTTNSLTPKGAWRRIEAFDLQKAFESIVPGSEPLPDTPDWFHGGLENPFHVLYLIANSIQTAGDVDGYAMCGYVNGISVMDNPVKRPTRAYIKSSKGWKSGTSTAHALGLGNLILINYTPDVGASAPTWTVEKGGKLITLDLPDAPEILINKNGAGKLINPEEACELQNTLMGEDIQYMKDVAMQVYEWLTPWGRFAPPVTLACTKNSARTLNAIYTFLDAFYEPHSWLYNRRGIHSVFLHENVNGCNMAKEDYYLGNLPYNLGKNCGTKLYWLASNGANGGIWNWFTAQSIEDLEFLGPGFYSKMTRVYDFSPGNGFCQLLEPTVSGTDAILIPHLNIKLPDDLEQEVCRLEDRRYIERSTMTWQENDLPQTAPASP